MKNFRRYRSWCSWTRESAFPVLLSTSECQKLSWSSCRFWLRRKCVYERSLMTAAASHQPAAASYSSSW